MKVSLNIVKQFTDIYLPLDELKSKINSQLGAFDETINLHDKYRDALIVKVVTCDKHPAADRLSVCKVDDSGVTSDIERDENGYVQVVCGAPNVKAGMLAVWLPPRSVVPATYGDENPFILGARELRGVMSQGMLAAADELAVGSDHDGILEINPKEPRPIDILLSPGIKFAEAYGLDDFIINIENKMFTHRPDLFGQLGVAREIAGITHEEFKSPDWYRNPSTFKKANKLTLEAFNDASDSAPRFMAVAIKDVEVKPSPLWLQCALVSMGAKPINNIVDITNYVMLLTAQPVHAYDYDKLNGSKIGARMAKQGETVTLLNDKTYELDSSDIVIVDSEGPIGLAGIMGGGNSEVSASTKNIVLEVANFDMYTVRRTSMRHGIFTDALTRFNKGQSPLQNHFIMSFLMDMVLDIASGEQASGVYDSDVVDTREPVEVGVEFINDRLGLSISASEMKELLENVELRVSVSGGDNGTLKVDVPFWRTDIEIPEDVVEEVGRLYGFDRLPRVLPSRSARPTPKNGKRELATQIRSQLSRAGANEVYTYSFVHEKIIQKVEQSTEHAYGLSNALSPDLQYYRLSVLSSLLDKVHMNSKAGFDPFALFEIGKVHFKDWMDPSEPQVPNEETHVALVFAYGDKKKPKGAPFYQARKFLEQIADISTLNIMPLSSVNVSDDVRGEQLVSAYDTNRSAVILHKGEVKGVVGEFKSSVRRAFKLPAFAAGFEVSTDVLDTVSKGYTPLSRYPGVTQDISLKVPANVQYGDLYGTAKESLNGQHTEGMTMSIAPVAIYQAADNNDFKTVTFRVKVASYDRTLRDKDVTALLDIVAEAAQKLHKAERI